MLLASGKSVEAIDAFEQNVKLLEEHDPYEVARSRMRWGDTLLLGADENQAKNFLQEAQMVFVDLGAQRDVDEIDKILRQPK